MSGKSDGPPEIPAFLRRYKASEECFICDKECTGAWDACPARKERQNYERTQQDRR